MFSTGALIHYWQYFIAQMEPNNVLMVYQSQIRIKKLMINLTYGNLLAFYLISYTLCTLPTSYLFFKILHFLIVEPSKFLQQLIRVTFVPIILLP